MTDTPPPVLPPDPTVSGWHWIKGQHSIPFVMYWQPGTVGEWLDGDGTSYTPKELTGSQHVYIEPVEPPRTHAEPNEVIRLRAEVAALREAQTRAAGECGRLRAARRLLIENEVEACTECGGRAFEKHPNCTSCTDAVDERIAAALTPKEAASE